MPLQEIKYDSNFYIPRDDYAELLDYYLNKNSFDTYRFQHPGTQYQARWTSSAIYALEMLLIPIQLVWMQKFSRV